jgi:hypothetical protein
VGGGSTRPAYGRQAHRDMSINYFGALVGDRLRVVVGVFYVFPTFVGLQYLSIDAQATVNSNFCSLICLYASGALGASEDA